MLFIQCINSVFNYLSKFIAVECTQFKYFNHNYNFFTFLFLDSNNFNYLPGAKMENLGRKMSLGKSSLKQKSIVLNWRKFGCALNYGNLRLEKSV